jgi:hypothetical protein
MKNAVRLLWFSMFFGVTQAAPFLAMGDSAELFLTGAAAVKYDDNIFMAEKGKTSSDLILSVTPGFDLVFGKGSATTGNFYYREELIAYADHSKQNTSLSNIGVNAKHDSGKSKFDFGASYAQVAQNTADVKIVDQIVRRKVSNARGMSEFGLTEKTSLALGLKYDNTDYGPASYTDLQVWTLPIDVYYQYSEKLATSVGFQYRDNNLGRAAIDNNDLFFNLGARGEFTPKLTGQVRFGYTTRSFDRGSDQNMFGMEGSLTYADSEKTNYRLNFANDFGNAGTGDSQKIFKIGLAANSKLTEQWTVDVGLNYSAMKYPTRKDHFITGNIGIGYAYNAFVNFNASYNLTDNRSNSKAAEFSDNMLMFGASIRY